ncbi:MAG: alcohol dehydrogenase catalytic domain-containing protein [Deltaproteobacteria bacterium]|nr:alcohol dehydrogenase catalytic domain-containing protein [Deltaproteobacteria bacterium]MBW1957656.1 alcohol dehydrogenase catalytic domain-containing protein [Deltaproteobacteria bacterium]MBW2013017.1 alcohol dehydrogenase catalytic domain-containing protein [Deltaproteobacteria bacterium]MBW2088235.1 alcohol dehydrogenase catalytic domain-containing protein [Deltaproteobacteria bacterium]MBW2319355.1 alcohol dehydrogenase catalytic domain-containing protein [Deltaproteobacteria bacterium
MKAWILEKQAKINERPLKLTEVPTPHAKDGEIRIKILVCGVCRTDIHIAEGDLSLRKTPLILGHEIVGIVDDVGNNVKQFKVGDKAGVSWLNRTCGKCKYCLSGKENYCPDIKSTGWDEDGGYAEYITVLENVALPLNDIRLEPSDIAPLMCPGIAGYAAFKLTKARKGSKLGLYGFGPTAFCVLKVAKSMDIEVYVSTRSPKNIEDAINQGADWAADTAKEQMPCTLGSAIVFPPAGNLVEPVLSQVEKGGTVVLAPVSSSPIVIENYTENLWGRTIETLYNLKKSEADEFLEIADRLKIKPERRIFPFEDLQDVLITVRHGKAKVANSVIKISD